MRQRRRFILLAVVAIILGVGMRLYLAYGFYGNFDQKSYEIVSDIMARGGNVYGETERYNYSPFWAYLLLGLRNLSASLNLPFQFVVRGFLTLADVANAILIGAIAAQLRTVPRLVAFSVYLLNPVSILIVGYHGQFDNLAILPLLLATYLWTRQDRDRFIVWAWVLGTCALLIKHITRIGVWTLYLYLARNHRRALLLMIGSVLVFLLTLVPYWSEGESGIVRNVMLYQRIAGRYGFGMLFPRIMVAPIFLGLMIILPSIARYHLELSLPKAMEFTFVAFLALTYGIGEQYFIYPVIWGSIYLTFWYWQYSLASTIFLLGSRHNVNILQIPPMWNLVWGSAMLWLMSYLVTWRRELASLLPSKVMEEQ